MEDNVLRPEYSGDTRHTQTDVSVQPGKYFSLSLLFYVYECLSIYLYVHKVHARCLQRSEESIRYFPHMLISN